VTAASGLRAVDLFAGWGGFTLGAEQAGAQVVWAANHWPLAVEAHALNHPLTVHACQDLRQADWTQLPEYDVLLAAPACQGHSQASQPKRRLYHDAMRATAWAVIDCAEVTLPRAVVVENVPDFLRWKLYRHWRAALSELGYRISEQLIDATDHGVPQRRKRVFVVACREQLVLYQPLAAPRNPPHRPPHPVGGGHLEARRKGRQQGARSHRARPRGPRGPMPRAARHRACGHQPPGAGAHHHLPGPVGRDRRRPVPATHRAGDRTGDGIPRFLRLADQHAQGRDQGPGQCGVSTRGAGPGGAVGREPVRRQRTGMLK